MFGRVLNTVDAWLPEISLEAPCSRSPLHHDCQERKGESEYEVGYPISGLQSLKDKHRSTVLAVHKVIRTSIGL